MPGRRASPLPVARPAGAGAGLSPARAPGGRLVRIGCSALLAASLFALPAAAGAQPSPDPDRWFGTDKALHLTAGFGSASVGYALAVATFDDRWAAVALGSSLALSLGAAKEGLDAAGMGTPSWKDFVWTAVGAALGLGVSVTFDAALRGASP